MKKFIIIFREPDGRAEEHTPEFGQLHRQHWNDWFAKWGKSGNLAGGDSLKLEGRLVSGDGSAIQNTLHQVGTEIVGGFLLINADDLDEAAAIAGSCPIYEADGYAEVRELQNQ
jgi:hypothetical protein